MPACTTFFEKNLCHLFPLSLLLKKYYAPIVKREVLLGKINEEDQVLCIGGGALPWTAVEIATQTGATVHVIDSDPYAVKLASKFIRLLKLEGKVNVRFGDGQYVDASGFTVAHIALQAYPQEKILCHLLQSISRNGRVLVRCPKKRMACLYGDCIAPSCLNGKSTKQSCSTMKETLLFTKYT
ncbi:hypothetical protein [Evansella sp. AB-P1]|uniref:hypothetical protein n=1 Tax=Evansella sp. AB-P1 TaxID=3037653 RepID=UPI00325A9D15